MKKQRSVPRSDTVTSHRHLLGKPRFWSLSVSVCFCITPTSHRSVNCCQCNQDNMVEVYHRLGPVVEQPAPGQGQGIQGGVVQQWMELPEVSSVCPRGLEYLLPLDTLKISRRSDILGNTRFEAAAMFSVQNKTGQDIYQAWEDSTCCDRCCKGRARPFTMHVLNHQQQEIFQATRPCGCCRCYPCCGRGCSDQVVVESSGVPIGYVVEQCGGYWDIQAADMTTVMYVGWPKISPCCSCSYKRTYGKNYGVSTCDCTECCHITDMTPIWNLEFDQLGTICVTTQGCCPCCNSPDYKVIMPLDLDVKLKATLLAFAFYASVKIGFQGCC